MYIWEEMKARFANLETLSASLLIAIAGGALLLRVSGLFMELAGLINHYIPHVAIPTLAFGLFLFIRKRLKKK